MVTLLILSHSCFAVINLNVDVRSESCAIQGGNLSLIRISKVTVFSQTSFQSAELMQQHSSKTEIGFTHEHSLRLNN